MALRFSSVSFSQFFLLAYQYLYLEALEEVRTLAGPAIHFSDIRGLNTLVFKPGKRCCAAQQQQHTPFLGDRPKTQATQVGPSFMAP